MSCPDGSSKSTRRFPLAVLFTDETIPTTETSSPFRPLPLPFLINRICPQLFNLCFITLLILSYRSRNCGKKSLWSTSLRLLSENDLIIAGATAAGSGGVCVFVVLLSFSPATTRPFLINSAICSLEITKVAVSNELLTFSTILSRPNRHSFSYPLNRSIASGCA
uniref:Uncharacterized protein n=1 Tax=Candidatus Methanophagaceae archaeon ANME-1 ERB6 TaxID=2759912 RepID=A0A7G9Z1D9_9EURY|nr:hypothetical protein JNMMCFNH_00025 [Methanosarcinales archaeon ANME-1 ERB6]